MNNKLASKIIFLIVAIVLPYLLITFVTMDANPLSWMPKYRAVFILFSFMTISFSGMMKRN